MRTIAVLPVKSFHAGKQRLSPSLGGGSRQLLAQAMFSDVLAALRRVRRLDAVAVVTDDHEIEAMLRGDPVTVLHDDRSDGQSAAAMIGIRHAMAERYRRALLVPGDTPLIDPRAVDALLETSGSEGPNLTIVPDRHREGTNALLICPPDAFEPSFGPGSLERHLAAAREAELEHRVEEVESLMHDVDSAEDLAALGDELERHRGVAPRTRGALRQFDRLHVPPPPWAEGAAAGEGTPEAGAEAAGADGSRPGREAAPATWHPTREGASGDQRPAWA
jgi:2-phospho-L-lactate/phosphoenolpyruvate guanylyltransferase